MPNAQGRITIRRRPKNGEDGSDAVIFRFIPSASSIVLQKDGTLRPSALSARLVKNEGGLDIDMISQAFEGYTVLYHIKKSNGNSTSGYTPGTSLNLTSHASTLLSVDFELHRDSKVVASISVPCIPAGIDGEDVYLLDLDNEMQGIPCNSSGTPTGSGTLASTNSTVYKGSKVDTGWTFAKTDTNCTSSIDANGTVSVTAITADKASVKVTATKGTMTREAVMSLYKVKPGSNGSSPVVYSIEVSASSISRDKTGTLNPTSITAYKQKTVGNSTSRTTEMVLKYLREGQDSTETTLAGQGGEIKDMSAACTAVIVTLYSGTTVLDKERIPIVKDGKPGSDVFLLDLDNEVQGIPCNSAGTPTGTGTLATTNSTVYKGASVDSGWTFSKEDTGCTSSIDANGKVSVTAITADKASVKVSATKDSVTLSAVMSLYKVKPGSNGSSPVIYSLEISDSAISRDAEGGLTPDSISVFKNKTTGSSKSRTSDHTLTYQRIGQDSAPVVITGQGGTINNISSDCTAIELKIKNGSTVLDAERVPIVKDGIAGEDGYTIVVSPSNINFNFATTVLEQKIRVDVYKGSKKLTYSDDFLCSTLATKNSITTGLTWNFNTDDDGFYYTLRYVAGNDVNIDIPFTITIDDSLKFHRSICVKTVKNGIQGPQGIQGCVYRRSKHVNGFKYHNDSALTTDGIRYIDLVYIMKDSTMYASHALWFRCKKTHDSNAANAPQITNTGNEAWLEYWEPMNTLEPLYTPFLLADDAVITLMQSNQILIANDDGVITAGMSGSLEGEQIRIWAGAPTPDDAPFKVDVNGKMTATDAVIEGNVKATSGNIGNWFIYQDCIASTHGTVDGVESDDYTLPNFKPDVILNGATGELLMYSDKFPRLRLSNASIVSLFNEYLLPQAQIDRTFSKSCTPYIPYSSNIFRWGVGTIGTISLGYMEEGSKITISQGSMSFYVPAHGNNSSATVSASVNGVDFKIKVIKNGSVVTTFSGTSGLSKSKGELLSISFTNKSYTIPEGGEGIYSLEVELKDIGFTVSSSGSLANFKVNSIVKGSYQHGGFNKTVIGNDGFGSFWQDAGFIFSQSGLVTRIGNIGFRVNSNGIQKCTNATVSNPTWTNI